MQNQDNKSLKPISAYTIDKNEFSKWLEICESTRIKLNKTQVSDKKNSSKRIEILFSKKFK